MWIFTPEAGFLSVVCARRDGKGSELDPDRVMIRARNEQHLARLRERHAALKSAEVLRTPHADYPVRMIVPRGIWSEVLAQIGNKLEYGNFKAAVAAQEAKDSRLDAALHDIWARMLRYQQDLEDEARG